MSKTEAVIAKYPDRIRGVKIRIVGKLIAKEGLAVVKAAKKTADRCHLPLMVHIGDREKGVSPSLTRELLPLLEEGDILSHIYTGQFGGLLGEGRYLAP